MDFELVKMAKVAARGAKTAAGLREAQAVLLPAETGVTLTRTAALLGVGTASVGRLQARFRRAMQIGPSRPRNWGGRRREPPTRERESEFLAPWLEQAKTGGLLVVAPLRAALAEKLGRAVKASVVYGLLSRHGWRKVAPDTAHPKSDPVAQADWKKNSRRNWRPC